MIVCFGLVVPTFFDLLKVYLIPCGCVFLSGRNLQSDATAVANFEWMRRKVCDTKRVFKFE